MAQQDTILIVEDNPANLNFLADNLGSLGYRVLVCEDGQSALECAEHDQPDIILLDIKMADMDGFETCRRLKAKEATGDIPVIFMTALADADDKVTGFEVGAVDYIVKPPNIKETAARIRIHLATRHLQRSLAEQNELLTEENQRRRWIQDALRESRERYRILAENSTDLISRLNPGGVYRYVSPVCKNLLGYEIEEMVGKTPLDFIHPEDLPTLPVLHKPSGEWPDTFTVTVRVRCKDNHYLWLETTYSVVKDEKYNLVVEVIGVARDVTARVEAQQALKQARDELEIRVQERTAELAKTSAAYGRFVPHEFLRFLERASIVDVKLGDYVQREMTIMFSDIRAFSSLSEEMTPEENFRFLNSYLRRVSPVIRLHHGFIDKYIGDAVMALFPEKPEDALQAAIAMQQTVARYNEYRQTRHYSPISIGVGIHTGLLMLGTIGEEMRMEGTVISDAVNLASRVEGLTKVYGASIVVSQDSLFGLDQPTSYHFRFLDRVQVKGKKEPVSVFEIFNGDSEEIIDLKLKTRTAFEKGLLYYHGQEFEKACQHFQEVLNQNPHDKAADIYLKRSIYFLQYGVPSEWEGVQTLTEK